MSKLIVKNTEGMKTPFLRGILTSSLLDAGVSFELAYKIASQIRQQIGSKNDINTEELRNTVSEQLRQHSSQKVLDRYLSISATGSNILVKKKNADEAEPFSRGQFRLCMEACGLSSDEATTFTHQIYHHLLNLGRVEISGIFLGRETYRLLKSLKGEKAARRYLVWSHFVHSNRPLILLIGGASGVGKSTIATEVGHRLGIVRTQSTDMLREVMRMMTPRPLSPVLHTSSYCAWKVLPDIAEGEEMTEQLLISGYLRQTELLTVACEAIVNRALTEKVSLIIEGVHIHTSLVNKIKQDKNAIIVPIMLSVLKAGKLKEHFKGRSQIALERKSESYLQNFNAIWDLQSYLMGEADTHQIPIVSNISKEKAIQEVMKTINDKLFDHFSFELDEVFPLES